MPRKAAKKRKTKRKAVSKTTRSRKKTTKSRRKNTRASPPKLSKKTKKQDAFLIRPSGFAVTSLVASVLGWVMRDKQAISVDFITVLKILFQLTALIAGLIALKKLRKHPDITGRGLALTGVILSSVWLVFYIILALIGLAGA